MTELSDPEIDVHRLMAEIREAATRRKAAGDLLPADGHVSSLHPASTNGAHGNLQRQLPSLDLYPEMGGRNDERYGLYELLKYYDREFIENAYRAILKREPDQSGLARYLEHLRAGRLDRVDILASLRSSVEGRARGVEVEGLKGRATLRRLYRLPAVGYFIEWLAELGRLPLLIRQQRRFEAYSQSQQERVVAHINQVNAQVSDYFRELREEMNRLAEIQEQRARALSEQMEERARALSHRIEEMRQGLGVQIRTQGAELRAETERLHAQTEQLRAEAAQLRAEAAQFRVETTTRIQSEAEHFRAQAEHFRAQAEQFRAQAEQFSRRLQSTRTELVMQERRTQLLLEEMRKLPTTPAERPTSAVIEAEGRHFADAFYASFEEHFRGSREEIMNRLRVYLPLLSEANITAGILDIGTGRGEWLEILRGEGREARGVDTNRVQAEACRARGLEVIEADALSYLRGLPDGQLNAVTGFHVIEHLEFETLVALLDEVVRTLAPNGLVIFETPNPENVFVGTHNFHVDPTHRKPLPIPMMKFLLESRGFSQIEVIRLHPSETPGVEGHTDLAERFNEYFYGPMDYAITGRKG
jgi:SAM-dependent methyltransferase